MPNDEVRPAKKHQCRLKLIIAYDGFGFSGWQSQVNGDTIQDRLEFSFAKVTGRKVRLHGAGRTDAGVHALGQCAHADLDTRLDPAILRDAVNASLPPSIRVLSCRFVPRTFHARFSARGKIYRYRIATTPVLSPFEVGRTWHVTAPLDDELLRACANEFVGQHDFAGFAAQRGVAVTSTIRTIRRVRVGRTAGLTTIEVEGDGFLYKMVRLMVGAMVRCALGKTRITEVRQRLRRVALPSNRFVAPAAGLTLVRVQYDRNV